MYKISLAALAVAITALSSACGSPSEPTMGTDNMMTDTMPDPVMAPVNDFNAEVMEGRTVRGEWTADSAVWVVLGISDDMPEPVRITSVPTTHFLINLPERFMGKMVTLWVQRMNSLDQLVGPESNHTVVGPIEDPTMMDPPVTEDPCESIRSMESHRWTCPTARNGDVQLKLEVRDRGATCYLVSLIFQKPKEKFTFNLPDNFVNHVADPPTDDICVPLSE